MPFGAGAGAGVVVGTVGRKRSATAPTGATGATAVAGLRAKNAGWALAVRQAKIRPQPASRRSDFIMARKLTPAEARAEH